MTEREGKLLEALEWCVSAIDDIKVDNGIKLEPWQEECLQYAMSLICDTVNNDNEAAP